MRVDGLFEGLRAEAVVLAERARASERRWLEERHVCYRRRDGGSCRSVT